MDAAAPAAPCMKPASLPPPPALFAVRATRSRVADQSAGGAAFSGPPDTPPRRSPVTVPFLWEDAPGKPKAPSPTAAAAPAAATPVPEGETGDRRQDSGRADPARGPLPLKLPPRLQQVPSFAASSDTPLSSPKTVLHGPYGGCAGGGGGRRKPPRWARSGGAPALWRTTSVGVGLLSRTWSKPSAAAAGSSKSRGGDHERDAAGPDAPWCSPASSSSTSSSVSTCFGGDDHGRGGRPGDAREVCSEEDDGTPRGLVRITRFRRNRSLPSMTTSNLWASLRRSFKQITPWS